MRQGYEWTASRFGANWGMFKQKHPQFNSWDYIVSGSDVVYVHNNQTTNIQVGYIFDVGAWEYPMLENHLLNVLRVQESEYERKQKMEDQQEKREAKAQEEGEKFGRWLLAINPSMPMDIIQEMAQERAEEKGFGDMKTGMRFFGAVLTKYNSYKESQKQITLDSGTYNLE